MPSRAARTLLSPSGDDPVCADGEPAGSDPAGPVLPARGAEQESGAGGRRGPLLPGPQERAGPVTAKCFIKMKVIAVCV